MCGISLKLVHSYIKFRWIYRSTNLEWQLHKK